ncbi:head-tail connector protein [Rhizobium sp. L1K21]|uniref:head-tail connector protein n=1 Tax=Rhizobium sp. L1K21 TaxID=2954933 RepID=UPI00209332F2|nr:head-tail connector protein [Rhizobium sp. L1K21]MCO6186692.1 head-tail connector protein [Rhizobium sp. L1K21]
MTYALVTPPAAEPLTLADVKAHLRLDGSDEDDLLAALIAAARQHLEASTGLCLITQGWRLYLDRWPWNGMIEIAKGPLQLVESVTVYDGDGVGEDVSLDGHVLDAASEPARFFLESQPLPGRALNGIEIDFLAGFGDAATDVPDALKRAMLMHVALMYELRGAVSADMQPAAVPAGYERLISPYRTVRL